jgi:2,3-bisphosphoglycerate-dependent phosphoglycerate mutase
MSRQVYFVRHAESTANAGHITSKPGDSPLTARGWLQAQCAADAMVQAPELIVTSAFVRAKQTAEPLSRQYPRVPCEVWNVQEFTYLDPKRCQSMTYEDRRPLVEAYWRKCEPTYQDSQDCESFQGFMERVYEMVLKLTDALQNAIVVFTHGQFMRAALWLKAHPLDTFSPSDMRSFDRYRCSTKIPNCAIIQASPTSGSCAPAYGPVSYQHLTASLLTL